jgi:hypothetical protein
MEQRSKELVSNEIRSLGEIGAVEIKLDATDVDTREASPSSLSD